MTSGEDDDARARLARLATPARAAEGWVPRAPDDDAATAWGDAGDDPHAARGAGLRERALAAAVTGYTAAHGHPLEHAAGREGGPAPRRWAVRPAAVVAALLVLAAVTGAVAVRALAPPPSVVLGDGAARESDVGADTAAGADADAAQAPAGTDDVPAPAAPGTSTPGLTEVVVVHVVGQVGAPGLVELPLGSRVADALAAAGGALPTADLAAVNLARELVDGEQVLVPQPGEAAPPAPGATSSGPSGTPGTGAAGAPLDLNAADVTALDALPGIGPVLAGRIVAWRDEHGRFTSVDELAEVPGIGPALLGDLRDLVRV